MQFQWYLRQRHAGIRLSAGAWEVAFLLLAGLGSAAAGGEPKMTFKPRENGLNIFSGDRPVATYFFAHDKIARPFYADVFTLDGLAVTRTFPPKTGEAADHADMHPGIWLAFGDLNGHDFWRNKSRVKHLEFPAATKETQNEILFVVRNDYIAQRQDGEKLVARETCRHYWSQSESGLLFSLDSEFESADPMQPLVFGDQEEMGLGVRIASNLRVKDAGGVIRTSNGNRNEKEAWGKQAAWCDYSGKVGGLQIGVTLMPHPANFRKSWYHVRDYGLMVANPFGRNAFTGGEKSRVEVKPGEKLRLRFGIWVHSGKQTSDKDLESAYQRYLKRNGE